jgi:hypothetical protein
MLRAIRRRMSGKMPDGRVHMTPLRTSRNDARSADFTGLFLRSDATDYRIFDQPTRQHAQAQQAQRCRQDDSSARSRSESQIETSYHAGQGSLRK